MASGAMEKHTESEQQQKQHTVSNSNNEDDLSTESAMEEASGNPSFKKSVATSTIDHGFQTSFQLESAVIDFLPKVEPLPRSTFFCLFLWCATPAVAYIFLFTQMGWGGNFYFALSIKYGGHADVFASMLALFGFVFYIFDIGEWNTTIGGMFRFTSIAAMFILFVISVTLISNKHPYGLISLFAICNPLWLLMVKSLFYKQNNARTFVCGLSGPLLLVGMFTIAAFVVWIFHDQDDELNDIARVNAAIETGCMPDFSKHLNCVSKDGGTCFSLDDSTTPQTLIYPENCSKMCLEVYSECSNGFILWIGPVFIGLSLLFHSFFCTFLRTRGTSEKDIFNFGKLWAFVLFVIWASASLSGAGSGVSSALMTITMTSLLGSTIFLLASYSHEELNQNQDAVLAKIHMKYGNYFDVFRGLFVVMCSPVIVAYFAASALNQVVRKIGINPCAQPSCATEASGSFPGIFTLRATKQLNQMKSWDRVKVFTYAIYWGVAFMILQVLVAKLTVVFFTWMIKWTSRFGLAPVTFIMIAMGLFLFLFPPVPGMPIYMAFGIILPAQAQQLMGWTWSVLYSSAIGTLVKVLSGACQQKLFGEKLSHYVQVRQFVGINSTPLKALRLVVGKDGLSLAKVAILMGGPDWPTSVICGIMRLSIVQIAIGTLPAAILVLPSCMSGTFMYMASLKDDDSGNPKFPMASTLGTIAFSVATLVQVLSGLVAVYYIEQAVDKRGDEIAAIQDDQEVEEADRRDERMKKCYSDVTQWSALPIAPKLILTCSLVAITLSCYSVQLFTSSCFVEYSLTDSIDEKLEGSVAKLFLPLGWAAVVLFMGSMILLGIFLSWGKRQARILLGSHDSLEHAFDGSPDLALT